MYHHYYYSTVSDGSRIHYITSRTLAVDWRFFVGNYVLTFLSGPRRYIRIAYMSQSRTLFIARLQSSFIEQNSQKQLL